MSRSKERPRSDSVKTRLAFVERCVSEHMSSDQIVRAVKAKYGVKTRSARYDIAAVYERIAKSEQSDTAVRVARAIRVLVRRMRRNEKMAEAAIKKGNWGAAASFESNANFASDRLMKIYGLFAPKKIEVSGSVGVQIHVSFDTTKIVDVLDLEGLKALRVVMAQVDAAKQSGLLKPIDVPSAERDADPLLREGDDEFDDDDGLADAFDHEKE